MLIIRIYKNWRIRQKWHYDERYKEYVTLNCKNPVAAIDRAKKQMIIDQRKREALSAALDLTDSLPTRVTRGTKRAIQSIVNAAEEEEEEEENEEDHPAVKKQKRSYKKASKPFTVTSQVLLSG